MPQTSLQSKVLSQDCVYWPKIGSGENGKPILGDAEALKCRWTKAQTVLKTNEVGTDEISTDKVMTSKPVEVEGYLFKGKLSEVNGREPQKIGKRIKIAEEFESLKREASKTVYRCYLI